jgi:hypothetical protein
MRHISFALTTDQVRNQTKTVTRRLGWRHLVPGTVLQPVVKAQGLKKGEKVEKIGGPIRVTAVERQLLSLLGVRVLGYEQTAEMAKEGFPDMGTTEFVVMFCEANKCAPSTMVTRIEFEYTEPAR